MSKVELDLQKEIPRLINLLSEHGIHYSPDYIDYLIQKYTENPVPYPKILQRLGDPNIRKHPRYAELVQHPNKLLDFGCGTGDDIRALISDGYPKNLITAYDLNDASIQIGYDFYMDQAILSDCFIIAPIPPFKPAIFQTIYSGSVIHALGTKKNLGTYLRNAYKYLKPSGILLGSTLGNGNNPPSHPKHPLLLLKPEELKDFFYSIGFQNIELWPQLQEKFLRLWFYAVKM